MARFCYLEGLRCTLTRSAVGLSRPEKLCDLLEVEFWMLAVGRAATPSTFKSEATMCCASTTPRWL